MYSAGGNSQQYLHWVPMNRSMTQCRICTTQVVVGNNGMNIFCEEGRSNFLQLKIQKYLYIEVSREPSPFGSFFLSFFFFLLLLFRFSLLSLFGFLVWFDLTRSAFSRINRLVWITTTFDLLSTATCSKSLKNFVVARQREQQVVLIINFTDHDESRIVNRPYVDRGEFSIDGGFRNFETRADRVKRYRAIFRASLTMNRDQSLNGID